MEQSKPFHTVKMLFLALNFPCYKKLPQGKSQQAAPGRAQALAVPTLHIVLQDLCEHHEQSLLKAAHGLGVGLARYPDGQADGLKHVMVKVGFAGILQTSYKQRNQPKLADKSLNLLNVFLTED